ncbi:unnamed protein product, partial [Heterotrigona itama]
DPTIPGARGRFSLRSSPSFAICSCWLSLNHSDRQGQFGSVSGKEGQARRRKLSRADTGPLASRCRICDKNWTRSQSTHRVNWKLTESKGTKIEAAHFPLYMNRDKQTRH